jgi:hypothetical protein
MTEESGANMGFRRDRNKIEYVEWRGEEVRPTAGHFTVYYWHKGTPRDPKNPQAGETWVKADIYGLDGKVFLEGLLASNLEELKHLVVHEVQQAR